MSFEKFWWAISKGADEWSQQSGESEDLHGVIGEGFLDTITWDSSFARSSKGAEADTVDIDWAVWAVDAAEAVKVIRRAYGSSGRIVAIVRTKESRRRRGLGWSCLRCNYPNTGKFGPNVVCCDCGWWDCGHRSHEFREELAEPCSNCQDGVVESEVKMDEDSLMGFERGTIALLRKFEEAARGSGKAVCQRALAAALWRTVTGHPMLAACVDFEPVMVTIENGGRYVKVDVRFFPEHAEEAADEG